MPRAVSLPPDRDPLPGASPPAPPQFTLPPASSPTRLSHLPLRTLLRFSGYALVRRSSHRAPSISPLRRSILVLLPLPDQLSMSPHPDRDTWQTTIPHRFLSTRNLATRQSLNEQR